MTINYMLITLSFFVPIIRALFHAITDKTESTPRDFVFEWLASGLMACLIQFIASEVPLLKSYETLSTIITALFGRKLYMYSDANFFNILRSHFNFPPKNSKK